jgi:hypothetical protein
VSANPRLHRFRLGYDPLSFINVAVIGVTSGCDLAHIEDR